MNFDIKLMGTGRQYGFASKLRRHRAQLANHETHDRSDFLRVLADCHQNLGIEGRADSPARDLDEEGEEIKDNMACIEWDQLACPKCNLKVSDTANLLKHVVHNHGKEKDKKHFDDLGITGKEMTKLVEEAAEAQASSSYVKKKFENSKDLLVCPVDSPLAPFLVMKHLQVFIKELPPGMNEGVAVKLQGGDLCYTVIFYLKKMENKRRRVRQAVINKRRDKKLKELERNCAQSWVGENDIVLKAERTAEEHRVLAKSLRLPTTCSHDDILKKVSYMKQKYDEINNVYQNTVKSNGQVMTSEEKKLISSLTSSFMAPVSGKRKTTYKSPSELLKRKKTNAKSSNDVSV